MNQFLGSKSFAKRLGHTIETLNFSLSYAMNLCFEKVRKTPDTNNKGSIMYGMDPSYLIGSK